MDVWRRQQEEKRAPQVEELSLVKPKARVHN